MTFTRSVAALSLVLGSVQISAQTPAKQVWVAVVQDGSEQAAMAPRPQRYAGGPLVAVPAKPMRPGDAVTAAAFRLRSWAEGDKYRVTISILNRDKRDVEIASALLGVGSTWEVRESDRYHAARFTVLISERPKIGTVPSGQ